MSTSVYNPCNPGDGWWKPLVFAVILAVVLLLMASCTTTKYVTVPEYHKEYIVRSDTVAKVDSVVIKDSVFVYHNGDTVIINKVAYRDRVKNVYKVRTDTICKTDSVRVPYQTEKELDKSEKFRQSLGWIFAVVLTISIIFWWYRKKKN